MRRKKKFGDRPDGRRIYDSDPMHVVFPYVLGNRCDNEVCITEKINASAINEYIKKKNLGNEDFEYTAFHVIMAALARVIAERPRLNRFYAGYRLYERDYISFAFAVKKEYTDDCPETMAIVGYDPDKAESPIDQIYGNVRDVVKGIRCEGKVIDGVTAIMKVVSVLPRFLIKAVVGGLNLLDYCGLYPRSVMEDDPYFSTCFVSNLKSIRLNADYHHLANRGTNSIFMIIGRNEKEVTVDENGNRVINEYIPLSIVIDERIADGVYFSKSISKFRKYLAHPDNLDTVLCEKDTEKTEEATV